MEVEGFEKFLHRTFVGQKRFSIEGVDALVPILDKIIAESVQVWYYECKYCHGSPWSFKCTSTCIR